MRQLRWWVGLWIVPCLVGMLILSAGAQAPEGFAVPPGWQVHSRDVGVVRLCPSDQVVSPSALIVVGPEYDTGSEELQAWFAARLAEIHQGEVVESIDAARVEKVGRYEQISQRAVVMGNGLRTVRLYLARKTGHRARGFMLACTGEAVLAQVKPACDWFVQRFDFAAVPPAGAVGSPGPVPGAGASPPPDVAEVRFEKHEYQKMILDVQEEALGQRKAARYEALLATDQRGLRLVRALRARLAREPERVRLEHDPYLAERELKFLADVQYDQLTLGEFEKSLATAREVQGTRGFDDRSLLAAGVFRAEAEAHFGLLRYEKSLRILHNARSASEGAAKKLLDHVKPLLRVQKLDEAQAATMREFYEAAFEFRLVVTRIIKTLQILGAWEEALAMYDDALMRELHSVLSDEKCLGLLLQAQADLGGAQFAERIVQQFRELNRGSMVEQATGMANLLRDMANEQSNPVPSLNRALETLKPLDGLVGDDPIYRAVLRGMRGTMLLEIGRAEKGHFDDALAEMRAGLTETPRVPDPALRRLLQFKQQMALVRVYLELDQPARAREAWQLTSAAAQVPPSLEESLILADLLGQVCEKEGRFGEAVAAYKEAVRLTEDERRGISIPSYKQTFFRSRYRVYERYIRALHRAGRDGDVLRVMEAMRARTLLDALGGVLVTKGVDPNLAQRMRRQAERERELIIDQNRKQAASGPSSPTLRGLESVRLASERTATYAQVIQANPELAQIQAVSEVSVDQILRAVPADTVMLEYLVGTECRAVVVAGPGRPPKFVQLDSSYPEICEQVSAFRKIIQSPGGTRWRTPAMRLYEMLVAPVAKDIKGARRLLIVPNGTLNYLPWAALVPTGAPEGTTLMDTHSIVILPCSSVLDFCRGKKRVYSGKPALFALGNVSSDAGPPLPGTVAEVDAIATLFPGAVVCKEGDFTVANLKRARGAPVIHLATHGVLDVETPENSAVITAEGRLLVGDIFNLDLSAGLVVLSACETGRGRVYGGDEIVGLTRAFMYAGTPSVVATLWGVSDESTSRLMVSFYKNLQAGKDKGEALRQAQIELRRDFESPFHWAPFVLQGSWE